MNRGNQSSNRRNGPPNRVRPHSPVCPPNRNTVFNKIKAIGYVINQNIGIKTKQSEL